MRSATGETLRRKLASLSVLTSSRSLRHPHLSSYSSASEAPEGNATSTGSDRKRSFSRRAVPVMLLSLTGGVALSTINDLAIFHGCSMAPDVYFEDDLAINLVAELVRSRRIKCFNCGIKGLLLDATKKAVARASTSLVLN